MGPRYKPNGSFFEVILLWFVVFVSFQRVIAEPVWWVSVCLIRIYMPRLCRITMYSVQQSKPKCPKIHLFYGVVYKKYFEVKTCIWVWLSKLERS